MKKEKNKRKRGEGNAMEWNEMEKSLIMKFSYFDWYLIGAAVRKQQNVWAATRGMIPNTNVKCD